MSLRARKAVNRRDRQPPRPAPPPDASAIARVDQTEPAPVPEKPKSAPVLDLAVRGLKIASPIPPQALNPALLEPDGQPQPDVELHLTLATEGTPGAVFATARINGKSYRRVVKAVQNDPQNGFVLLQGTLAPQDDRLIITGAGLLYQPRLPKPEPNPEPS